MVSRSRLDHVRPHAARSARPRLSAWTRLGFYADAADVFWQDWVLNYNLDRQLQLASRVGESSRHFGWNWTDGPRWLDRTRLERRCGISEALWLLLLGVIALAVLGKFLGRDGWRWWTARRQVLQGAARRGRGLRRHAALSAHAEGPAARGIEKPAWLTPCEFARVVQEPEVAVGG